MLKLRIGIKVIEMIPRKIHYCWFGGKEYSPLVNKCMQTWAKYLPDWDFVLWNESNSPINHPFVKKALLEKKYAFAADYVRFYALYNFGGIYLDTDMELIKNLDPLLNNSFFSGSENFDNKYISAGIIGSVEKHEYLKAVLAYYDDLKVYETSPSILTKIYNEGSFEDIKLYEYEYFYPYNPFDPEQEIKQLFYSDIKECTFAIHHWNFSWKPSFSERLIAYLKKILKK